MLCTITFGLLCYDMQEKIELNNQLSKVREDAEASESTLKQQIQELTSAHEEKVQQLESSNASTLEERLEDLQKQHQEKIDALIQSQREQIEQVLETFS